MITEPTIINHKIDELLEGFEEEVIGTVFVPKEHAKEIMRRKMVLLTEFLNKKDDYNQSTKLSRPKTRKN